MRLLLADDHTLVRAGLRALLDGMEGVTVVAEADNGEQAVALAAQHQPDVALLDAGLGIQDLLLDLAVADRRPQRLVVVDATQAEGRAAGECWEVDLASGPARAGTDLHSFPALSELGALRAALGVEVRVVAVQAGHIPAQPAEGLSPAVAAALPAAAALVLAICRQP